MVEVQIFTYLKLQKWTTRVYQFFQRDDSGNALWGISMPSRSQSSDPSQPQLGKGDGGPLEAAAFIAEALADMRLLSSRHDLGMLTYLLDMAHTEAIDIVRFPSRQSVKPKSS